MRARGFALGLAVVLCALPLAAQNIPPGDDVWDSLGGGATDVTLSSADWYALCGANVPDTAVLLKGGAEAPVSRPNVRALREAGWF